MQFSWCELLKISLCSFRCLKHCRTRRKHIKNEFRYILEITVVARNQFITVKRLYYKLHQDINAYYIFFTVEYQKPFDTSVFRTTLDSNYDYGSYTLPCPETWRPL